MQMATPQNNVLYYPIQNILPGVLHITWCLAVVG